MPSCFSIQRTRVVERIPYLSLSLLGMTIWPFEVTFDDVYSICPPPYRYVATRVCEKGKTESNVFSYSFSLEQAARNYAGIAIRPW